MADVELKVGQIWRDNDPRRDRYVRIVRVPRPGFSLVRIRCCDERGDHMPGYPETGTNTKRFGRKGRDGFTLVKEAS